VYKGCPASRTNSLGYDSVLGVDRVCWRTVVVRAPEAVDVPGDHVLPG
jgi:hypothetical protein